MAEERRRGLSAEKQEDMYDKVNKMHTILLGNGVKGKIQEFEEQDDKLERRLESLNKKFWIAVGALGVITFIAPFIADKFL